MRENRIKVGPIGRTHAARDRRKRSGTETAGIVTGVRVFEKVTKFFPPVKIIRALIYAGFFSCWTGRAD